VPDSRSFARKLVAFSLIVTPLLLLIGVLIGPDFSDDASERLGEIADDKGTTATSAILFLLAPLLFIPGMVGLIHLLRGPRLTLGQIAAGALLLGALATVAFYGAGVTEYVAATEDGFDRSEVARMLDESDESGLVIPIIVIFFLGLVLGGVVLGIVLWRRGVVPVWAGLALSVSAVVGFVGESKAVGAIGFVLLAVGLIPAALKILSMSDAEWERWIPLGERADTPAVGSPAPPEAPPAP
jgi:hypothetical protein